MLLAPTRSLLSPGLLLNSRISVPFGLDYLNLLPNKGIRQGAPESPLIFSLVIDVTLAAWVVGGNPWSSPSSTRFTPSPTWMIAPLGGHDPGLASQLGGATGLRINLTKCTTIVLHGHSYSPCPCLSAACSHHSPQPDRPVGLGGALYHQKPLAAIGAAAACKSDDVLRLASMGESRFRRLERNALARKAREDEEKARAEEEKKRTEQEQQAAAEWWYYNQQQYNHQLLQQQYYQQQQAWLGWQAGHSVLLLIL